MMSDAEMRVQMRALFEFFERQNLTPGDACAVMGNMLCHLVTGLEGRRSFISTLAMSWGIIDNERSGKTPTQH